MRMRNELPPDRYFLFFDNYFSSPELLNYFKKQGVWAVSTLNKKRSRNCPIPTNSQLKWEGRGAIREFPDWKNQLVVATWFDNKLVLMLSNYVRIDPAGKCKRYDRKQKKKIDVDRAAAVVIYNTFMGRVDKTDMLLSLYRSKIRSKQWFHWLGFQMFNLALTNNWVLCKEIGGNDSLVKFTLSKAKSLIYGTTQSFSYESYDDQQPRTTSLKRSQVNKYNLSRNTIYPKYNLSLINTTIDLYI